MNWGIFEEGCNKERCADSGRCFFALNEAAVTRGSAGKIIDFTIEVSGAKVADMRGDGLVVATATGSTAYALSAGGPLVAPGYKGLVIVPVAPHTLVARAVLTDTSDIVEICGAICNASADCQLLFYNFRERESTPKSDFGENNRAPE